MNLMEGTELSAQISQCKPFNRLERMKNRYHDLEFQLKALKEAIEILEKNPNMIKVLMAMDLSY